MSQIQLPGNFGGMGGQMTVLPMPVIPPTVFAECKKDDHPPFVVHILQDRVKLFSFKRVTKVWSDPSGSFLTIEQGNEERHVLSVKDSMALRIVTSKDENEEPVEEPEEEIPVVEEEKEEEELLF